MRLRSTGVCGLGMEALPKLVGEKGVSLPEDLSKTRRISRNYSRLACSAKSQTLMRVLGRGETEVESRAQSLLRDAETGEFFELSVGGSWLGEEGRFLRKVAHAPSLVLFSSETLASGTEGIPGGVSERVRQVNLCQNVARVQGVLSESGGYRVLFESLPGISLGLFVERVGCLSLPVLREVAESVGRALQDLHRAGLYGVLPSPAGVQLTRAGSARVVVPAKMLLSTPNPFASPRSDLETLGLVIFALSFGEIFARADLPVAEELTRFALDALRKPGLCRPAPPTALAHPAVLVLARRTDPDLLALLADLLAGRVSSAETALARLSALPAKDPRFLNKCSLADLLRTLDREDLTALAQPPRLHQRKASTRFSLSCISLLFEGLLARLEAALPRLASSGWEKNLLAWLCVDERLPLVRELAADLGLPRRRVVRALQEKFRASPASREVQLLLKSF